MSCSRFKKGHIPWNKGLTKNDNISIMNSSIRMKNNNPMKNSEAVKKMVVKNFKGGKPKCINCSKTLSNYKVKNGKPNLRCSKCYVKFAIGPNSHSWKNGVSKLPYPFNFTKELKELIKKRDNYTCILCFILENKDNKNLSVHHIDYDKCNLNHNNLITLCRSHNSKVNSNREYWTKYFKEELKQILYQLESV